MRGDQQGGAGASPPGMRQRDRDLRASVGGAVQRVGGGSLEIFKMAWRNVWRNQRRTLVTIAAMSFALFVMILYAGLIEGYLRNMERSVLDLEVGDVQVFAEGYRDNPSIYTRIDDPEALLAPLDAEGFPAALQCTICNRAH